ncbi:uncharacterized protein [Haliotis asinina]|uniref:uncharacterized protein n=1 Tax=Haliotis asinina TaxID=109174 RepID=UPI00353253F5
MKKAVHVTLTFLTLWMTRCDVTSVSVWHRELSSVKGVCDAQCEALCQEQADIVEKCEDLCRPSTRRQWIINCTDGGDCSGAGYCSVLKNISQGGYLPPKPDVMILRDPVTRHIMLHWTLDNTTQHRIIYIVQWDLALHPETLFNVPPLPSQNPQELKRISWYTQGWTISDTYLVNEVTDVCVRPMFRVAAVSRFGSRWFTDPIKTPAIAPVQVRNITHSPFVYDANTEEIKFVLYWHEPQGWNNSEIIMYSWTENLDQPCSDSGQSVPVYFDSQTSTHPSNNLHVRIPKGGMGCKFKFQVRAFSRCTPNAVGPYSSININIDCNNVIGFSCPKPPIYNPPGNVEKITMTVMPIQRGYRVLMGWRPPTDKGSIGQIDQYHLRWGKLNLSTYDSLMGLGTLYNTSTKIVPGNHTWAEFELANSSQNAADTYGVQIIATAPGHSLVGSWLTPVTSVSPGPIGDDDAPPAMTKQIPIQKEHATVLKDDDGVVIVLVPKARGAKVYVTMPEERSHANIRGFSLQWGGVDNSTDKPVLVNTNTTFIAKNATSLVLDHLIANRRYGVQVIPLYNTSKEYGLGNLSNIDLEPEEEPEPDVHIFTMPLIPDPDRSGGNKSVLVAVSVSVSVVAAIVVLLAVVGLIVYKKRRKRLSHLQQRYGQDSDNAYSFYHDLGGRTRAEISSLTSPSVVADRWELPHSCLKLGQVLGSGAFGLVLKGKVTYTMLHHRGAQLPRTDGQDRMHATVAVKMLQEDVDGRYYRDFIKEINLMKRIGYHANVVSMLGCCTLRQPICLVVEHMANGDLLHYLKKIRHSLRVQEDETGHYENREVEHITPLNLLSFARQIARGMEFLSGKSFVHRDLAARNILVDDNKVLKIGDFGLTRFIYDDKIYINRHGGKLPVKWMSVEAIFDLTFSTASDVWSFGIVLFEIVTLGGTPYPGVANRELLSKLQAGYRMERPDTCSIETYQLMRDCWKSDPKKRPSFTEIGERIDTMIGECSGQEYLDLQLDESQGYYQVQNSDEEESDCELRMDVHDAPDVGNEVQEEDGDEMTAENREQETDGTPTAEVKKLDEEIDQDHHDREGNERIWATSSPVMCDRLRVAVSRQEDEEFVTIPKFITEFGSFKSERSRKGSRKDERKIPAKLQLMEKLPEACRREDRESDSSLSPLSDEVFSDGLYTEPYSYLQTPSHDCLADRDTSPTSSEISDNVFNTDSNEMSQQCHHRYERTTSEISTTSIDSGFPQSPLQTDFPGYSPKRGFSLGYSSSRLNSLELYRNRLDSLGYARSKVDFGYCPRYKQKYNKNASRSPQLVSPLGRLRRLTRHTSMSSGGCLSSVADHDEDLHTSSL